MTENFGRSKKLKFIYPWHKVYKIKISKSSTKSSSLQIIFKVFDFLNLLVVEEVN